MPAGAAQAGQQRAGCRGRTAARTTAAGAARAWKDPPRRAPCCGLRAAAARAGTGHHHHRTRTTSSRRRRRRRAAAPPAAGGRARVPRLLLVAASSSGGNSSSCSDCCLVRRHARAPAAQLRVGLRAILSRRAAQRGDFLAAGGWMVLGRRRLPERRRRPGAGPASQQHQDAPQRGPNATRRANLQLETKLQQTSASVHRATAFERLNQT